MTLETDGPIWTAIVGLAGSVAYLFKMVIKGHREQRTDLKAAAKAAQEAADKCEQEQRFAREELSKLRAELHQERMQRLSDLQRMMAVHKP